MLISIITPTYNSEEFLEKNLNSIIQQKYQNIEHIFIDNNSKDRTRRIIQNYKKKSPYQVKFLSEKDKGIYFAFNKGLKLATGNIITILNSDDFFSNENVLDEVIYNIKEKKLDFVYGNIKIISRKNINKTLRIWSSNKINNNEFYRVPHPSFFFKKKLMDSNGIKFNTNYKIVSDLDFIINCFKNSRQYNHINKFLVNQRSGGTSQQLINILKANLELYNLLKLQKINFKILFIIKKIFFKICQIKFK